MDLDRAAGTVKNTARPCRYCNPQTGENRAEIMRYIGLLAPGDLAGDEERQRREVFCNSCDANRLGTCLKCGCYAAFRAAQKQRHCPLKKW